MRQNWIGRDLLVFRVDYHVGMHHSAAAESFLAEPNVAVLATVDPAGRPHAAPVWYVYAPSEFVISTTRSSRKYRNAESNPDVTLVVDRRTVPYFSVIVRGRAYVGPALSDADLLDMAVHYYGEATGREYAARARAENEVTIRIQPVKFIEYLGETGRA